MKSNKSSIIFKRKLLVPMVFAVTTALGVLSCFFLQDFKIDYLSYQMINYNTVLGNSEYKSPILNIAKNNNGEDADAFYNNMFNTFHYNILDNGARTLIDSKTSIVLNNEDATAYNVKFTTQPTFSIDKENLNTEEDPVYHVDYGQYYSYFSEIVSKHRGTGTFMYISDKLADEFVEKLSIPGETKIEKYKTLITDENYCYQYINIDGTNNTLVSINNILHSNYDLGQSKRMEELYGDFSLIWAHNIRKELKASFEIDLKTNPFGNKTIIKSIDEFGCNASNSKFTIKVFNGSNYEASQSLSNKLTATLKQGDSGLLYIPIIALQILSLVFCFFISRKLLWFVDKKWSSIIIFALFFIYGIVVTYTYSYPLFSMSPLLFIVFWLVACYWDYSNKKGSKKSKTLHEIECYEIKI